MTEDNGDFGNPVSAACAARNSISRKRHNRDNKPLYYVIVTRLDGSEFILETRHDEQEALQRAALLADLLEDCSAVRASMDPASRSHKGINA